MVDNSLDCEVLSLQKIALGFIDSTRSLKLPKTVHDELNTVFTKRFKENGEANAFRKVVISTSMLNDNINYHVIRGQSAAIYNMLCLSVFLKAEDIKNVFRHCYETRYSPDKRQFDMLFKQERQRLLASFWFDVNDEYIKTVEAQLFDSSFDIFTKKLISPFIHEKNRQEGLLPLLTLKSQSKEKFYIDWRLLNIEYKKAEEAFENKKIEQAKNILKALKEKSPVEVSAITTLLAKVYAVEKENDEAWAYLQELKN